MCWSLIVQYLILYSLGLVGSRPGTRARLTDGGGTDIDAPTLSVVKLRLNMGRHGLKLNKALLRVGLNLLI